MGLQTQHNTTNALLHVVDKGLQAEYNLTTIPVLLDYSCVLDYLVWSNLVYKLKQWML